MQNMRAKMVIESVEGFNHPEGSTVPTSEKIKMRAVHKDDAYPADGSDENNTFAMFTPSASLEMLVNNPALIGQYKAGDMFYVDFTAVERVTPAEVATEEAAVATPAATEEASA